MKFNKEYIKDDPIYYFTTVMYMVSLSLYHFYDAHIGFLFLPFIIFGIVTLWSILTFAFDTAYITDQYDSNSSIITNVSPTVRGLVAFWIAILWVSSGFLWIGLIAFVCQSWIMFLNLAKIKYHKEQGWFKDGSSEL